jgi:membrane protease YdiL (CAAX protease family)
VAVGVGDVDAYLYWFVTSIGLYLVVPVLACALTPGIRIRDTGLGLGDWRFGLLASGLLIAVFLPVVSLMARTEGFGGHYPLCRGVRETPWVFVLYEATYVLYFFAWEYLFRGYLLFSLSPSMGKLAAVVQMMPFAVAHLGKPELESLGSIVAGVVLGLVALRARSAIYGGLTHAVIAVAMDLFAD